MRNICISLSLLVDIRIGTEQGMFGKLRFENEVPVPIPCTSLCKEIHGIGTNTIQPHMI